MIYIIGLDVEGKSSLSHNTLKIIENAKILIGGRRHLACFPEFKGKRFVIGSNLNDLVKTVKKHSPPITHNTQTVILATGDPNFFGIAETIIKKMGKDAVEIIPNVSAMQKAFAKIKENWSDARFFSVHGRRSIGQRAKGIGQENIIDNIVNEITQYNKIGIFTDPDNTPSKIANALIDKGIKDYKVYVCEDLGTEKERITKGTLKLIAKKKFSPLNVMILIRDQNLSYPPLPLTPYPCSLGIPDSEFSHSNGMITKEEIRVISLSKLRIKDNNIVWDIGAGCGSVSIEAAKLARDGMVFAIEKNKERALQIKENMKTFQIKNLEIICEDALVSIKALPNPDAVFIGGAGKDIGKILSLCSKRIHRKGRIVVNAITIETLAATAYFFKNRGWDTETISVNIAKTRNITHHGIHIFNAYNPVFIIVGEKP